MHTPMFARLVGKLLEFPEGSLEKRTDACGCVRRTVVLRDGAKEIRATETRARHCETHTAPGTYVPAPSFKRELPAAPYLTDVMRAYILCNASDEELKEVILRIPPRSSGDGLLEWVNERAPTGMFSKSVSPCGCTRYTAFVSNKSTLDPQRYGLHCYEGRCRDGTHIPLAAL